MKRGILIAVAALVALAAAPALWLVLDNGGSDRRSAALVEPTASGDVGRLTLTSPKSGVLTIPVQSFSWGMVVPQSASTGQATGQARHNPLQIIKPIDANSPTLFSMLVNGENLSSAKLDLLNSGGAPYLTYNFANASVGNWDDDTSEKLTLYYQSFTASLVKAARPVAPAGQVIGQLTVPSLGTGSMPIVGFATGTISPRDPATGLATGKRQHKPVTIRRAIDGWDPAVLTKVAQGSAFPTVIVELQRPDANGAMQTYATYTYTNAVPSSVEDSGAAGCGRDAGAAVLLPESGTKDGWEHSGRRLGGGGRLGDEMKKVLVTLVAVGGLAVVSAMWLSRDDGSRVQAALTQTTVTDPISCDRARHVDACAALNRLLLDLDRDLAEIDRRQQSVNKQQVAIKENLHYRAATMNELSQQDALMLQAFLEKKSQLEQMISNVMKAYADTQNNLAAALKAS